MKTMILLLFVLQFSLLFFPERAGAQIPPEGIVYQAEARDNKGGVIKKSDLTIQASILADNPTGSLVWRSEYQVVTDDYGFFTLILGQGNVLVGNFSAIAWGSTAHFLNISVFYKKEWTDMGTTQLLSVPYSFHSKTSTTALNFTETDPIFTVHPSFGITPSNMINWNQAFSWGNHAGLYHPSSYVPTWGEITMKPVFSPVATTGSYNDLNDKPTGSTIGDMTYWNGTQWTMIPVGRPGQYLQLNNVNIPAWGGPEFAALTTTMVTNITSTTAKSGGNIMSDGGGVIMARGVCWSIDENPTVSNSKTIDGGVSGEFISNLNGLTANQLYFVRAYATSSAGTSYGYQVSFMTNEIGAFSFFDDFSSDIGWTNETSGDYNISNGYLNWKVDRSKNQRMYIPINSYSGDFELSFDFKLTSRNNNMWLEVGLAESLTGGQSEWPDNSSTGIFLSFGWMGGGTSYSTYFLIPNARYADEPWYQGGFDYRNLSTYSTYTENSWFNAKLAVVGTSWTLTLKDATGRQVDQRTGTFPSVFSQYNYIYIGNPDDKDWPMGYGLLDNLRIN